MPRLRNNLLRAGVVSLGVHLGAFGVGALGYEKRPPSTEGEWMSAGGLPRDVEEATTVELVAAPVDPLVETEAPAVAADGVAADQAHTADQTVAPRRGVEHERASPSSDEGEDQPRAGDVAQRRDRSKLHSRLTDGSINYQTSRERTGATSSSPQPQRREPRVGIGDSSRTRKVGAFQRLPAPVLPEEETPGDDDLDLDQPALAEDPQLAQPGTDPVAGTGALDADRGQRRFDVETPGAARDSAWVRGASNERHPGIIDLSAPGTGREGGTGRGPGAAPGAVARPSTGVAANAHGAPVNAAHGDTVAMNTVERQYARHELEIRRRVSQVLRFPKRLALMLEQGETIVYFVVRPDGRLAGKVQVMKSAGFDEFDEEAVAAVERAVPFPRMERPLSVSMRVPFENPVVR